MHMLKYMPDHFGRHGFKRPQKVVCAKITMNVGDLEERLEGLMKDGLRRQDRDGTYKSTLPRWAWTSSSGSGR